jgi:Ca2+-binding EF-hand superfamily protein
LAQSKRPDGKLTKDDLPERLRDRFDKIDANHDGLIDEQELHDWLATVQRRLESGQNK